MLSTGMNALFISYSTKAMLSFIMQLDLIQVGRSPLIRPMNIRHGNTPQLEDNENSEWHFHDLLHIWNPVE